MNPIEKSGNSDLFLPRRHHTTCVVSKNVTHGQKKSFNTFFNDVSIDLYHTTNYNLFSFLEAVDQTSFLWFSKKQKTNNNNNNKQQNNNNWNITKNPCQKVFTFYWNSLYSKLYLIRERIAPLFYYICHYFAPLPPRSGLRGNSFLHICR